MATSNFIYSDHYRTIEWTSGTDNTVGHYTLTPLEGEALNEARERVKKHQQELADFDELDQEEEAVGG